MPLPVAPQSAPAMQLSPTFRGTSLYLCLVLPCPCPSGVGELPLAQVNCFSGCSHHGLDLFAHILTLPTLHLDIGSSDQCFDAGLCLCFHQLLNEGSMVIFKIFISLTIGQGQFGHPLLYCLGSCFQFLAIKNKAAMNIVEHMSLRYD